MILGEMGKAGERALFGARAITFAIPGPGTNRERTVATTAGSHNFPPG